MWIVPIFAAIWMGLVGVQGDVADFESTYRNYAIIFHHAYHLLLAIYSDNCYFVEVPDNKESTLSNDDSYIVSRLQATENSLLGHIQRNSSGEVTSSSLERVRSKYRDILADFHCLGKNIFEVNFYNAGSSGHHDTSIPTCIGKAPGRYPDPRDCHAFLLCDGSRTFYEKCAPGTGFLESIQNCDRLENIHGCSVTK